MPRPKKLTSSTPRNRSTAPNKQVEATTAGVEKKNNPSKISSKLIISIAIGMLRVALLGIGIYFAFLGQDILTNGNLIPGFAHFAVGGIFILISAFGQWKKLFPSEKDKITEDIIQHCKTHWKEGAVSLVLLVVSLILFLKNWIPSIAWICFFGSLFALIRFGSKINKKELTEQLNSYFKNHRTELIFLIALTTCAFILRVFNLSHIPSGLWFDESNNGLSALEILKNANYRPIFIGEGHEQPGLHFMILAIFIKIFGQTTFALRFPSAIIGTLTIPLFYFFAKRLLQKPGLAAIAATLLTFSSWHVNFSRIAFNSIFSVFFDLLALFFLVKGLQERKVKHFVYSGMAMGIGLQMYHSSRVFVLFLGLVCLLALLFKREKIKLFILLCFLGSSLAIAASPLALYAMTNQDVFFKHTTELNLFNSLPKDEVVPTIISNAEKHLLMFNYQADPIHRHTEVGKPLLDQYTGIVFALGLGITILLSFNFNMLIISVGFFFMLLGGIFSKPIDLPTSLRTIDDMLFVYVLAAITLIVIKKIIDVTFYNAKAVKYLTAGLLIALLGLVSFNNINKYKSHMSQYATWVNFNGPYTQMAEEMSHMDLNKTNVYFTQFFLNQPTLFYLIPNLKIHQAYSDSLLPFTDASKDYYICLHNTEKSQKIETFYPNVKKTPIHPPNDQTPEVNCFYISAEQIAATQGVSTEIYNNSSFSNEPEKKKENSFTINKATVDGKSEAVSIIKKAAIKIEQGKEIAFELQTNTTASLTINGDQVLNGSGKKAINLPTGTALLELKAIQKAGTETNIQLLSTINNSTNTLEAIPENILFLSPPINNNGLIGKYGKAYDWKDNPLLKRIDSSIDFYFHIHPVPHPFSITWEGLLDIPETKGYSFSVVAGNYAQVYIDNNLILDDTDPSLSALTTLNDILLTQGKHELFIAFLATEGAPQITLKWKNKDGQFESIPWNAFFPKELNFDRTKLPKQK
ncbi:MAG: glycosyltransferase family 39 protein [bacterium]